MYLNGTKPYKVLFLTPSKQQDCRVSTHAALASSDLWWRNQIHCAHDEHMLEVLAVHTYDYQYIISEGITLNLTVNK